MHHTRIMQYFHMYAKQFDLYKYIRYSHKVLDLKQASDFNETGNWEVYYRDVKSAEPERIMKEVYGAVMVCIGHHASPSWPSFPGMDKFQGTKMHSHTYKDFKSFENKKVLVVGKWASGPMHFITEQRGVESCKVLTKSGSWCKNFVFFRGGCHPVLC